MINQLIFPWFESLSNFEHIIWICWKTYLVMIGGSMVMWLECDKAISPAPERRGGEIKVIFEGISSFSICKERYVLRSTQRLEILV